MHYDFKTKMRCERQLSTISVCMSKKFEKRIRKRIRLFQKFLVAVQLARQKNLKNESGNGYYSLKSSLICSGGQRSGKKRRWVGRRCAPALPVRRSGRRRQRPEEQPAQPPGGRPAVRRPSTTPHPGSVPEAGPAAPALAGGRRGVRHGE